MAGNYDTTIKVGLDADLSGGVQTEKQLDRLKKKSRELGKDGEAAGAQMTAAFGKVSRAAQMFQKVLTGFGIAGAFAGVVAALDKIKESFGGAKREAEALAKAQAQAAHKKDIEELAKSYKELGEAIQESAAAAQHANEMLDINVKNSRELEDAQLALAEQKELAGVDSSDPAAAEKKAAIQARYAARRGETAAQRQKDDVGIAQDKLLREADAKRQEAAAIESSTGEDDRVIADVRQRRAAAGLAANSLNSEDATGFWSQLGQNVKRLSTLEWGKFGDVNTEAGDAKRKEAAAEEKNLDDELKQLEAQKAEKLKKAEALRKEAANAEEKANALGGGIDVANVRAETALLTGRTGQAAADRALEKRQAQVAADESTIAQGPGRLAALKRRIASVEAQKAAAISADAKEQQDAVLAQQALDSFNQAGHRRNGTGVQAQRSALEEDVARETREANQSRAQLQTTLATLAATLKGLNADLKKVERDVDAATRRQNVNNDDAPAG